MSEAYQAQDMANTEVGMQKQVDALEKKIYDSNRAEGDFHNIQPAFDICLIKPDEAPEASPGGILYTDSVRDDVRIGVVLAVGPGKINQNGKRIKMSWAVGDNVYFNRVQAEKTKQDGVDLLLVLETHILFKFDRPAPEEDGNEEK